MKASELRIGNLFLTPQEQVQQVEILTLEYLLNNHFAPHQAVNPIPLTPEWLEKAGFVEDIPFVFVKGDYDLEPLYFESEEYGFYINEGETGTTIKYLHQLQNLYFALTGEELQFKD